ncbi:MAG: class II fructose-bisphosphate aldolase [Pseudomonadota bacterium]
MIVNLKTILAPAMGGGYGVPCFNLFGYEDAKAVVAAAEEARAPVIMAANLDFVRFMPLELIAQTYRKAAEGATVPICIHLDHTYEKDVVLRAVDVGFTSVMFDGSQLPVPENLAITNEVADYAHRNDVSVEAEVGSVPYAEGRDHIRSEFTTIEQAQAFADEGQMDALAVSVGNIHRLTEPGVTIDYGRLEAISAIVDRPLVIHGTTGIFRNDLETLARTKVSKFNIGTSLRQAFGAGIKKSVDDDVYDRLTMMGSAIESMQATARDWFNLLGAAGRYRP